MTTAVAARRAVSSRLEASAVGRVLLAVASVLYILLRRRRLCLVHRSGRHWVHRWRGATITDPILTSRPPEDWDAEVHDITLHDYTPHPGDVVIDVGAGVGHETRVLSKLVGPAGRIVAIEANPRVYACLQDMVDRNGLENVTCVLAAAAAHDGTLLLDDVDDHLVSSTVGAVRGVKVDAVTIDGLADRLGLGDIAFVKMNIEGGERDAVRGMDSTLGRAQSVCISCHDFLADEGGDPQLRTMSEVREVLESRGFTITTRADDRPWVRDCLYGRRT